VQHWTGLFDFCRVFRQVAIPSSMMMIMAAWFPVSAARQNLD